MFSHIWATEGAIRHSICHGFVDDDEISSSTLSDISVVCLISLAYNVITKLVHDHKVEESAYFLWEKRGKPFGDELTDWYEAEKNI
ncbi:MAG: DUF2934 domain-containing protein [Planctomycetes bacterium]|nr:DUF2934 domain-containing protein [Planctomycetota bacterium]